MSERQHTGLEQAEILSLLSEGGEFCVRVRGDCMSPGIRSGDRARIRPHAKCRPGDVVAVAAQDDPWVCHRFLGYARYGAGRWVLTKADSNSQRDRLVPADQLIGKVVGVNGQPLRTGLPARLRAMAHWLQFMFRLAWQWLGEGRRPPGDAARDPAWRRSEQ